MTEKIDDLGRWCRANWDMLPELIRKDCLAELRSKVPPEMMAKWKAQHAAGEEIGSDDIFFHHGNGMAVRNILRKQLRDLELPAVHSPNYPPEGAKNWDDYYTGALQELVETSP